MLHIFVQLLLALNHIHGRGIMHRCLDLWLPASVKQLYSVVGADKGIMLAEI